MKTKVDIALKIGIISERKAHSTTCGKYYSVQFIHKSIQELLAAIYIIHDQGKMLGYFLKDCNSIFKVMHFSGVITAICGLDYKAAKTVLKHTMKLAETDDYMRTCSKVPHDVKKKEKLRKAASRDSRQPLMNIEYPHQKISFLYHMQCIWHNELENNNLRQYYVRDIYLDKNSHKIAVEMAKEIMLHSFRNVISIALDGEKVDEQTIAALTNCTHVTVLQISYIPKSEARDNFFEALHKFTKLEYVRYNGYSKFQNRIPDDSGAFISHVLRISHVVRKTNLTKLECTNVFIDESIQIECLYIKSILFEKVFMSPKSWKSFITGLRRVLSEFYLYLKNTNIDYPTVSMITYYSNGTVLCNDGVDESGNHRFILFHHRLKSIELENTSLLGSTVSLSPAMTSLSSITLSSVNMPTSGWKSLLDGLKSMQGTINVMLRGTNIDDQSASHIVESPSYTVISNTNTSQDDRNKYLCFITKPASELKVIKICNSSFGDSGLKISCDMTTLQKIKLYSVRMSRKGWNKFAESIHNVERPKLCLKLEKTQIEEEASAVISSYPHVVIKSRSRFRRKHSCRLASSTLLQR